MSPEICAAERYSHHSDIWSLGCIIYELATRQVPFEARSHMELVLKIKKGNIKPLPSQYSQDLTEAISACLKTDPRSRPDCAQLLTVANIKVARTRLESASALGQLDRYRLDRDATMSKLEAAQKQIQELQLEVVKLREANKKVEMEWHARATLAIDQKVHEASEKHKIQLLAQFETAVDQRAEEKLTLHLKSLPANHHSTTTESDVSTVHVRSSTPPPGKNTAATSFETFLSTAPNTDASSLPDVLEESVLEPELTSLSLNDTVEEEAQDDFSPLANRIAKLPPKKAVRKPFTRAKTLANYNFGVKDSPRDVHMADPSPQPQHYKGLCLSPRRNPGPQERLTSEPVKRNIFSIAAEKENMRPAVRGRTLVELSQSPAKWNPAQHGDEMPSPFIKNRSR